jgi:hypothetical protein
MFSVMLFGLFVFLINRLYNTARLTIHFHLHALLSIPFMIIPKFPAGYSCSKIFIMITFFFGLLIGQKGFYLILCLAAVVPTVWDPDVTTCLPASLSRCFYRLFPETKKPAEEVSEPEKRNTDYPLHKNAVILSLPVLRHSCSLSLSLSLLYLCPTWLLCFAGFVLVLLSLPSSFGVIFSKHLAPLFRSSDLIVVLQSFAAILLLN